MNLVAQRVHRKRRILVVLGIVASVAIAGFFVLNDRHPDTSSVASFAPYESIERDILPHWSPDDSKIIYAHESPTASTLSVVSSHGGSLAQMLPGAGMPAWSPDGTRIAFGSYRRSGFHLKQSLGLFRAVNVWISDSAGHQQREITNMDADCLEPAWSPDGAQVAFTQFPGPRVMTVAAGGGEPKYVADGLAPAWSPDGKQIAYMATLPGGHQYAFRIFVQPVTGGQRRQLRSFALDAEIYHATPSLDWSPDGERLLTLQLVDGRWQPLILNVRQDTVEQIVPVAGSVAGPRWSHDGKRIVYSVTDSAHPPAVEAKTLPDGPAIRLSSSREYNEARLVRYPSADGLEIPAWLYLPRDPRPVLHPAIIWLHGTMPAHGGSTSDTFHPDIQYFVDQGFVVLAPNYRGSAGFGDALAKFAPGQDPVPDVIAGAKYLQGLDAVDASRIALLGYSFGGYLTMKAISEDPGVFAAAIDYFGPVDLPKLYRENSPMRPDVAALLGGTPESNPIAYRSASPINFVDRITTPVLLLYGTRDPFYEHSVELAKALKQSGKPYEYLTYRFAGHGFSGKDSIDANQQVLRFLSARLKRSG